MLPSANVYTTCPALITDSGNSPNQNVLAIVVVALCTCIASILFMIRVYSRLFCFLSKAEG